MLKSKGLGIKGGDYIKGGNYIKGGDYYINIDPEEGDSIKGGDYFVGKGKECKGCHFKGKGRECHHKFGRRPPYTSKGVSLDPEEWDAYNFKGKCKGIGNHVKGQGKVAYPIKGMENHVKGAVENGSLKGAGMLSVISEQMATFKKDDKSPSSSDVAGLPA